MTLLNKAKTIQVDIDGHQFTLKSSGSGIPIVLLHTWHPYAKLLAKSLPRGYQIVTLDTPGYYSEKQDKPITDVKLLFELLDKLFDELKFNNVILMGQCAGSVLALGFANRYPDRIEKLILITPPIAYYETKANLVFKNLIGMLDKAKPVGFIAGIFMRWTALRKASSLLGEYKGLINYFAQESEIVRKNSFDKRVFFGVLKTAFELDFKGMIESNPAPTLHVLGGKDPTCNVEKLEKLISQQPNSISKVIPNCKHSLVSKRTKRLHKLVLNFLIPKV
ncbi:MAG: alpha/beta hydrolase [Patescibacteria group bacterium]